MTTSHDSLCLTKSNAKAKCVCSIIETARLQGYESGIREMAWECGDCGNQYDYTVERCPNAILDELAVAKRAQL